MTQHQDDAASRKPSLLVFVIAYEASRHIGRVLDRIPRELVDEFVPHIVVIDDASTDNTAKLAQRALERMNLEGFTWNVLANPRNQGYGGNQKLGYQYAVTEGFDVVVMVHGDGQYPPEMIAPLAHAALESGAAFGSRMGTEGGAIEGGMPRYKWLGNRVLTEFQNKMLGTELTEFHSGFRAYSTETLRKIPFRLNSPDFHFDTEIFIQCTRAGINIAEIDIPTHYGDEVCRVNGVRYARDVASQTMRSKLHDMGLMYERKFDVAGREAIYESKMDFLSPPTAARDRVDPGSTVLDLGSSTGHLAAELRESGCRVIGVDIDASADEDSFDEFHVWNLDWGMPDLGDEPIDTILMLDVIEHLRSPEAFVDDLVRFCHEHGVQQVLVSTGNVVMLMAGQFNYGPRGILDMTHTRLFTQRTIERLFKQARFDVLESFGLPAPFDFAVGEGSRSSTVLTAANNAALKIAPTAAAFQFFITLRPPVQLDDLIMQSAAHANVITTPNS